jgi:hypothetical protein
VTERETRLAIDPETRKAEPFPPGNDLALRHGGHVSPLRLAGRITELADLLRDAMPLGGFHAAVQATAIAGARLEAVLLALEKADAGAVDRLEREANRWWRNYVSGLDRLGLTPVSAAKLGVNLAVAANVSESALERHIRARYTPGEVVEADGAAFEEPES